MQLQAPPAGTRTLCELNCRLLTAPTSGGALPGPACPDADLTAAPATQPLGGYAPVVKCPSGQWPPSYAAEDGSWDSNRSTTSAAGLRPLLQQMLRHLPGPAAAKLEALLGLQAGAVPVKPLAWHPQQPLLAAVDAGDGVLVFDYAGRLPLLGQGVQGGTPQPLQPALHLQHDFQQRASAAAWRPFGGKCLAVGVAQGVCLWRLGRPPAGSGSRSDSSAWVTWLKAPSPGVVSTLAWHPQGHLLAAAAPDSSAGFFVWDVATGTATSVSAGPEAVTLLRWSPCGSYLLAGHPGGDFRLWQTQSWWSQRWSAAQGAGGGSSGGGELVEACWAPDSRSVVLAYERSPQLVTLHFTGQPPSLQAQLLPLPLAELAAKGTGEVSGGQLGGALIQAMAWDTRAQRLAVALGDAHPAAGCVALFDVRCDPILSARFIGLMRLGPLSPPAAAGALAATGHRVAAEAGWEEIQPEEVAEAAGAVGGPSSAVGARGSGGAAAAATGGGAALDKPQLAFLPSFVQGAMLAARGKAHIAVVPLYFAA